MVPTFPYQETGLSALESRVGVGPPARDPRFDVGFGPSARDPRLDVGFGLSANDLRSNVGFGLSPRDPRFDVGARDPRLDVGARDPTLDVGFGQACHDLRLEIGPTFQARSLYGDYIRPNMYK
ncbi:unnamed protein product [Lactuca saligna]|uniref:Uncharacterized protein n=1 Tax=Lactuca saligna TaxID=75948 RepID=A0AA35ZES6_LACSI|nr:unnamed protein product [Lactuca saligna]